MSIAGFCICGLGLPYLLVQVPLMLWWRWKGSRTGKAGDWQALPRAHQSEDLPLVTRGSSSSAQMDEGDSEVAMQETSCHVVSNLTGVEVH